MTVFRNDPELLQRFRTGDRAALSFVYWHYVGAVEATLRRRLAALGCRPGQRAWVDLADTVQEVFVKAFAERARLAFDGEREYAPYLMSIARNALIDSLRASPPPGRIDLSMLERSLSSGTDNLDEPLPWADPETMLLVEQYTAKLSAAEHGVYIERYVRGQSQEQTARALGISRQQVRTLESRLRAGLAREIARPKRRDETSTLLATTDANARTPISVAAKEAGRA
jgi:RNA polymerase sigma factor (sigma-70 family)